MPHDDKGFLGDKTLQVLDRAYRDARRQLKQASRHDADNPEVQRRMARAARLLASSPTTQSAFTDWSCT